MTNHKKQLRQALIVTISILVLIYVFAFWGYSNREVQLFSDPTVPRASHATNDFGCNLLNWYIAMVEDENWDASLKPNPNQDSEPTPTASYDPKNREITVNGGRQADGIDLMASKNLKLEVPQTAINNDELQLAAYSLIIPSGVAGPFRNPHTQEIVKIDVPQPTDPVHQFSPTLRLVFEGESNRGMSVLRAEAYDRRTNVRLGVALVKTSPKGAQTYLDLPVYNWHNTPLSIRLIADLAEIENVPIRLKPGAEAQLADGQGQFQMIWAVPGIPGDRGYHSSGVGKNVALITLGAESKNDVIWGLHQKRAPYTKGLAWLASPSIESSKNADSSLLQTGATLFTGQFNDVAIGDEARLISYSKRRTMWFTIDSLPDMPNQDVENLFDISIPYLNLDSTYFPPGRLIEVISIASQTKIEHGGMLNNLLTIEFHDTSPRKLLEAHFQDNSSLMFGDYKIRADPDLFTYQVTFQPREQSLVQKAKQWLVSLF